MWRCLLKDGKEVNAVMRVGGNCSELYQRKPGVQTGSPFIGSAGDLILVLESRLSVSKLAESPSPVLHHFLYPRLNLKPTLRYLTDPAVNFTMSPKGR